MNRVFATLVICLTAQWSNGQTMIDILKWMPTYHLEGIIVDTLIKNRIYYPPDNSKEEAVKYSLYEVNDTTGTLRIEMNFETGQRAFVVREWKRIVISKKKQLVIYSTVAGLPVSYGQSVLQTYLLKKGRLRATRKPLLPKDIGLKDFFRPNTPSTVIDKYNQYANHCYELIYEGKNICYVLFENFDLGSMDRSWLLGNKIEFVFENGRFTKMPPYFDED
ncbi:MAG: hypothetical protein HYZ44_17460 [Bacteroidetes bacterium]|nr:hypothetical protein [Bacteroidota bacterium]